MSRPMRLLVRALPSTGRRRAMSRPMRLLVRALFPQGGGALMSRPMRLLTRASRSTERRRVPVPADETAGAGLASTVEIAPPLTLACIGLNLAPDPEKMRKNVQAQRDVIRKNFTEKWQHFLFVALSLYNMHCRI